MNFVSALEKESARTFTENGGVTNVSSGKSCLDLFFYAGAMRNSSQQEIAAAVIKAYTEDPVKTMKIIFYARDVRGGLGERRFFRIAVKTLAEMSPEAVERNIPYFAYFGRYDDLITLIGTPCGKKAEEYISDRLYADIEAMENKQKVSLLAKWLPSVNASSKQTRETARELAAALKMSERDYRKILSRLRAYSDILENRLRERDYTFDYSKQPSCAMFKYMKAFIRNDGERYEQYINSVEKGEAKLNTAALYPYQIIRSCLGEYLSDEKRHALDVSWKNLPVFGENGNSIAVVDGSGSMTISYNGNVRPLDAALSLGIYFAEHNKGAFSGKFITFSENPRLVTVKGNDIFEKTRYCAAFDEVANTNLERVFDLILTAAVKSRSPQEELPEKIFVISDMEFDRCVYGGNDLTMYEAAKKKYAKHGYRLPRVVFWNVNHIGDNVPVTEKDSGTAVVSGFSPVVFDMMMSGEITPSLVMERVIGSERYAMVG